MQVQPYLFFDGRCEEALEFYRKAVGAEVKMLMRFKDSPEPPPPGSAPTPADKVMHASFKIGDSEIMASDGQCAGKQNGIIMRSGTETLLSDSTRGAAPVVAIIQMLVPDSRVQVPATRQTDWLLNLLPVPDIVPGDPQAVPQARFRGGKDLH